MTALLVKSIILLGGLLTAVAYLVLLERKMAAWIQDRRGPNRVGIPFTKIRLFGLGQPLADGLKFLFKEEYTPGHVDRVLYTLAPLVVFTAALAVFAVIPFGHVVPVGGRPEPLVVAPGVDVGILYVFAVSSIAVYGVILGGWASDNKYSFLGALRSSAQLIAYEIPLGLGILGVVLLTGTLGLQEMIELQAQSGVWLLLVQPVGFLVFAVAACAEAARLPFDLLECEQELVGGYHTEYAGMKMAMFAMGEFVHMLTASVLIVVLYLGGWHFWGLTPPGAEVTWGQAVLRIVVFWAKVMLVVLGFMVIRWSWPRFRFDQLMNLAWKVMVPLGLVNLVATAVLMEFWPRALQEHPWATVGVMWALALGTVGLWAALSPVGTRSQARHGPDEFSMRRVETPAA